MKWSPITKAVWLTITGALLAALPFGLAEYAYKNMGDNAAAMLFVMPVSGALLMLSFWAGVVTTLAGLIWLLSVWLKRRN